MLEIRDIQYFEDGRSVVDTIGGKRFKVLSRGVKDGYNTAKVEYLHDEVLEGEDLESKYWQLFSVQIDFLGHKLIISYQLDLIQLYLQI